MSALVSVAWLQQHLHDPSIVIVDATLPPVGVTPRVDMHTRYLERHLPGAVFFDIDALSDKTTTLPHMLPQAEEFAQQMGVLGIASDATIVVYEQDGVFSAPRAWWMLRVMGAPHVQVLDGGMQAWLAAGLPVESGKASRPQATFHAVPRPEAVRSLAEVRVLLDAGGQVIDARSAGRFSGASPEPRPGLSSGHMPGSTSVPYAELVRDGRLKPHAEIAEVFRARGIDMSMPITTSCGSGVTAAVLALGLDLCGAADVGLYDGSWAEYAAQPGAAIEKETPQSSR